MTPRQWAEVFRAGWSVLADKHVPAEQTVASALYAMEQKIREYIPAEDRGAGKP